MSIHRRISVVLVVFCAVAGCDAAEHRQRASASAGVRVEVPAIAGKVAPENFDLQGTAGLVRDGKVKDGKALEAAINRNPRNRVDLDGDGKRDRLQVVEHRDGDDRRFDVRAVPSGVTRARADAAAVPVAVVEVAPRDARAHVRVHYAPIVVVETPLVIEFDVDIVAGDFCHWVLDLDRPVFVGVAYIVIDLHHHHHKHKKHKKHKHW